MTGSLLQSRHAQRDFGVWRLLGAVWASFDLHHWTLSVGIVCVGDYGDGREASLGIGVGPCSVGLRLGYPEDDR